ncbi:MAG: hypothetical protein ACRD4E_10760 [Bryobacteraceae bacterium]
MMWLLAALAGGNVLFAALALYYRAELRDVEERILGIRKHTDRRPRQIESPW